MRRTRHRLTVANTDFNKFPLEIIVVLNGTPGPVWKDGRVAHQFTHKVSIVITEQYPYQKPVVRWQTPIFHPNIMMPELGGYVCIKLLDTWNFTSSLYTFIRGLECLLANPNPYSPYKNEVCLRAAEYFMENPYRPPAIVESDERKPKIVIVGDSGEDHAGA